MHAIVDGLSALVREGCGHDDLHPPSVDDMLALVNLALAVPDSLPISVLRPKPNLANSSPLDAYLSSRESCGA